MGQLFYTVFHSLALPAISSLLDLDDASLARMLPRGCYVLSQGITSRVIVYLSPTCHW